MIEGSSQYIVSSLWGLGKLSVPIVDDVMTAYEETTSQLLKHHRADLATLLIELKSTHRICEEEREGVESCLPNYNDRNIRGVHIHVQIHRHPGSLISLGRCRGGVYHRPMRLPLRHYKDKISKSGLHQGRCQDSFKQAAGPSGTVPGCWQRHTSYCSCRYVTQNPVQRSEYE